MEVQQELDTGHLDQAVEDLLHEHPVVGMAIGVVRDGRLAYFRGHGVADRRTGRPVTEDTGFRIASITKTFTAVAIMQLHERGLLDLDAPADAYLRSYRLVLADPTWPRPTVRQLLTHTAGLAELAHPWGAVRPEFGECVLASKPLPSLADFYGGTLRVVARPGSRFVYGNQSPATLGQIVEDVSGLPLGEYLRRTITGPLGMTATDMQRSDTARARLATGYEIRGRGVQQIPDRDMVTLGAAGLVSTPRDMSRYVAAFLTGGTNDPAAVLAPGSVAALFSPQYQPHTRIPGMGLGFFRTQVHGRPVVGHRGTLVGFHSQVFIAPDDGLGVMAFTNGAYQADFWLPASTSRLLALLLGVKDGAGASAAPQRPETWDDLVGWYRLDAHPLDIRLRSFLGFGAEVAVRGGALILRLLSPIPALARGFPLVPADAADPYVYELDLGQPGLEPLRVVFGLDERGYVTRLHLDAMPVTLAKQPPVTNPRRWAGAGLAMVSGLATAAAARGRSRR